MRNCVRLIIKGDWTRTRPDYCVAESTVEVSDPYHDIRILVFTRSQWEVDKQDRLSHGAGGMDEEVAHNDKYVFARYSRDWVDELKE